MECLIKKKYYWGPNLEISLCRYKYINLIRKDLEKLSLTNYQINSLIQSDLRDVSDSIINYDDIILSKNKIFYNNYSGLINKIRIIFKHYTNLFLQEMVFLNKNPLVLIKNNDKYSLQLYILYNSSLYNNSPIIIINKKLFFRLLYLYIKINKKINFDKDFFLINVYHLLLLYKSIGIEWSNIKDYELNLISSPIVKNFPFTYCSFFPFIEYNFGSCGFYKTEIIIKNNILINLHNLNINIIRDINIKSTKKNNIVLLINNKFKNKRLLKIEIYKNDLLYNIENIKIGFRNIKFK